MSDWTLFQWLGVPMATLLSLLATVRLVRRRSSPSISIFWLALWGIAAAAIAWPDSTTTVARTLGIARGSDLLLYCAVLAGFFGFWMMTLQQRRTQRDLTLLARAVALRDARPPIESDDSEPTL